MPQVSAFFDKFPDEVVEFDFDASGILLNGDTIANVQVTSLTTGFNIVSSSFVGSTVVFRVSGGSAGSVAYAVAKCTLTSGQVREGSITVVIKALPGS